MITLKNINKSFYENPLRKSLGINSRKKVVLKNINLKIREGEIIKLHGKNGSGKTTLLRIIAGIILPDDSSYLKKEITNNDIYLISNNERSFFWRLSIKENFEYFLALANVKYKKNTIIKYLEIFSLKKIYNEKFMHLSSGQKRLMLILRGILMQPRLLMLDEPFLGLDNENAKKINQLLVESFARTNRSLIIVNHDENDDIKFTRSLLLHKGLLDYERKI